MQLRFWPPEHSEDPALSAIHKVLEKVRREDPQLWALANARLRAAENSQLEDLIRRGWATRMPYTDCALYELKVPEQRRKGVLRVYFCCDPYVRNRIWLLEAEHKKGGARKEHKAVVRVADDRCKTLRRESGRGS